MPSKKFQRLLQEGSTSFRRGRPQRTPAAAILIVTEGAVTEPAYFRELRRRLAAQTVELVVEAGGAGDPRKLVEKALGLIQQRKRAARNRTLGIFQAARFDQVWIVFDTDLPAQQGRLHDGIAFAEANGVGCAHSTPCFEFWLLLHGRYTTAPMRICADAVARLAATLGVDYTKNGQDAGRLIPPMLDGLEQAVQHARRVRIHHQMARTAFPANPSTEVDRLIDAIRKSASRGA